MKNPGKPFIFVEKTNVFVTMNHDFALKIFIRFAWLTPRTNDFHLFILKHVNKNVHELLNE